MQNPLTKFPIHAGMLSFMLPGLGQVYQHRFLWAAPFFILHVATLSLSQYRAWILIPMAAAAWDAQRQPQQKTVTWNARTFSYLIVGGVAFFSAFSLMVDRMLPVPAMGKMSYLADYLADQIKDCAVARGTMPVSVSQCPGLEAKWKKDPWGAPFRYIPAASGFEIRSSGRDGQDNTDDDFVYQFRAPGLKK